MRLLHNRCCRWASDTRPGTAYVGQYGELAAASYLRAHGYRILRRNFRWGDAGEIDIVCRTGDTLVCCEVKSTTSPESGAPARAVDRRKRMRLRTGARQWLYLLGREVPVRFDIIEVFLASGRKPIIRHTPAAFTMHEGSAAWGKTVT